MLKHTDLDKFHLSDLKNDLHPSIFTRQTDYDLLILRLPFLEEDRIVPKNSAFILSKQGYYQFNRSNQSLEELEDLKELHMLLNLKIDSIMAMALDTYTFIETMEDTFYENKEIGDFNQVWFSQKNDLIRITRVLNKAIDEFKKFIVQYQTNENFPLVEFNDLLEHLERAQRNAQHGLEKLDALYSFYQSNSNEKMNKIMYLLTVISGIFLPLNLIVGFFGMNTTALPFSAEQNGTLNVIFLLCGIVLVVGVILVLTKKRKIFTEELW